MLRNSLSRFKRGSQTLANEAVLGVKEEFLFPLAAYQAAHAPLFRGRLVLFPCSQHLEMRTLVYTPRPSPQYPGVGGLKQRQFDAVRTTRCCSIAPAAFVFNSRDCQVVCGSLLTKIGLKVFSPSFNRLHKDIRYREQ